MKNVTYAAMDQMKKSKRGEVNIAKLHQSTNDQQLLTSN